MHETCHNQSRDKFVRLFLITRNRMSEKHSHQTRVSFYICHWGRKEGRKGFFTTLTWKDGWEERKKEISFIFFCFCFMSNETLLVSSVSAITCPHLSSIEELWLGFILKENRVIRYFCWCSFEILLDLMNLKTRDFKKDCSTLLLPSDLSFTF